MTTSSAAVVPWLDIDPAETAHIIETSIRDQVLSRLKRKGLVVGLSGGIDSSVVAALSVNALGPERVLGLIMPEQECSDDSQRLGKLVADFLKITATVEEISPILKAAGCYRRRDEAIRTLVPQFGPGHQCKLVMADLNTGARYALPSLVVQSPDGKQQKIRLTASAYWGIVAATNFKQRTRKMLEYYYADRVQYAVAGTPNRLEFDQGFFVKNGDGAADLKPIAHLYKSQVYQLADYLNLPREIRERPSTTDTFSLSQSQEEFYFSVPLRALDACLYGKNHRVPLSEIADFTGLSVEDVEAVFQAIDSKRRATAYLHQRPLLVEEISEIYSGD
jgi:NAD+ synthase